MILNKACINIYEYYEYIFEGCIVLIILSSLYLPKYLLFYDPIFLHVFYDWRFSSGTSRFKT